jgi:hypothetical protein
VWLLNIHTRIYPHSVCFLPELRYFP